MNALPYLTDQNPTTQAIKSVLDQWSRLAVFNIYKTDGKINLPCGRKELVYNFLTGQYRVQYRDDIAYTAPDIAFWEGHDLDEAIEQYHAVERKVK